MRADFVKTKNWQRFLEGLDGLNARGAEECRLVICDGQPGLGKTTVLARWAAQQHCVYLRAKAEWSAYWFLRELLSELGEAAPHGRQKRFEAALAALGARAQAADMAEREFAVVIDEADHIAKVAKLVETIRDLADISCVPFVLVGMGSIRDSLKRFPQTMSRVSRYVRFETADLDDVRAFFRGKSEVPIADDLAAFVLRATGGYNREILEAIKSIENQAARIDIADEAVGLTLAEMSGRQLINDRKTGQAIQVRAGV